MDSDSALDRALDTWLDRHEANGSAVRQLLNPPAGPAALDALEAATGFALPADLRALWRRADGQRDPWTSSLPAGLRPCGLFGHYVFLSVAQALDAYRGWLDVYGGGGPDFDEAFNQEAHVQRRGEDPVHREYWRPGWLPVAVDGGGNAYAADLAPAPGGTYGQVIVIGPDEDVRRVLAGSVTAFMADAARRLTRFEVGEGESPILSFDMEDRGTG